MKRCKACGAEIIWIKTNNGKAMPCDPEQVYYYEQRGAKDKIVTPNGQVLSCFLNPPKKYSEPTGFGYVPHWATCPNAEKFRKVNRRMINDDLKRRLGTMLERMEAET